MNGFISFVPVDVSVRFLREKHTTRLRASLRAVVPAIATLVLFLAGQMLLSAVFLADEGSLSTIEALLVRVLLAGLYVAMIAFAVRLATTLDRRRTVGFGRPVDHEWLRNFAVGAVISASGIALSISWGVVRGYRTVDLSAAGTGADDLLAIGVAVAAFVPYFLLGNVYEEVVYRGVMLRTFAAGLRARGRSPAWAVAAATAVSVLLFGAYHVPLRGNVVVAVDAAMVGTTFALAYVLTGELGLPLGVHFGRISLEFLDGFEELGVRLPGVVSFTRNTLGANLELKLLELGAISLFIVAWVALTGDVRIAENVYDTVDDDATDADSDDDTGSYDDADADAP